MQKNRSKKIASFFLVMVLSAVTIPSTHAETIFTDIQEGSRHYLAIKYFKDRNIIQGYEDGSFRSKQNINRAEALKTLLVALKQNENIAATESKSISESQDSDNSIEIKFPDVKSEDWFYEIIKKASAMGIINGYPDGYFHPEKEINRAESLKIALLYEKSALPEKIENRPYSDVPLETWFTAFATVSKERGLFLESRSNGGELFPDQNVTRGEFMELLYRMIQSKNAVRFGRATFYADYLAGNSTSSGEPYSPQVFTTAHRTLPFGTKLLVKNLANGKEIEVTVNDRGPYATGIELDLSKSAFSAIASPSEGLINIQYEILPEKI